MVYPHYPPSVRVTYAHCTLVFFCYMNLLKGTNSITRCSGELTETQKTKKSQNRRSCCPQYLAVPEAITIVRTLISI